MSLTNCVCSQRRQCVGYSLPTAQCGGYTLPWLFEKCAPGLTCVLDDLAMVDSPGTCQSGDPCITFQWATCTDDTDCSGPTESCSAFRDGCVPSQCRCDGTCSNDWCQQAHPLPAHITTTTTTSFAGMLNQRLLMWLQHHERRGLQHALRGMCGLVGLRSDVPTDRPARLRRGWRDIPEPVRGGLRVHRHHQRWGLRRWRPLACSRDFMDVMSMYLSGRFLEIGF